MAALRAWIGTVGAARSAAPDSFTASERGSRLAFASHIDSITLDMTDLDVVHNSAAGRFEAMVDGELCRADYRLQDGVMRIHHTEVPYRLEGRGIAGRIVAKALEYARENGLQVMPACAFVRAYMRKHRETQDLLAPGAVL
jgi:predicted GNAT family acetyltransferase